MERKGFLMGQDLMQGKYRRNSSQCYHYEYNAYCSRQILSVTLSIFCADFVIQKVLLWTTIYVYVADTGNHAIRIISPSGKVSTLAGTGSPGSDDGFAVDGAWFSSPADIAVWRDWAWWPVSGQTQMIALIFLRLHSLIEHIFVMKQYTNPIKGEELCVPKNCVCCVCHLLTSSR